MIAVTGEARPLARACDIVLIVETMENADLFTPTISRLTAMVVVDILPIAVILTRSDADQDRLARMKARLATVRVGEA